MNKFFEVIRSQASNRFDKLDAHLNKNLSEKPTMPSRPKGSSQLKSFLAQATKHCGQTFIFKLNATIIKNPELLKNFATNVTILNNLGIHIVIVHDTDGLVPEIAEIFGLNHHINSGSDLADHKSTKTYEMILCGHINKEIVSSINTCGASAVGISGKDANLIEASKYRVSQSRYKHGSDLLNKRVIDLGIVGEPTKINPELLIVLEKCLFVTVITPIAYGENGQSFVLDANLTAALMTSVLNASKLIIFNDSGPLLNAEQPIDKINLQDLDTLIEQNKIATKDLSLCGAIHTALADNPGCVDVIDAQYSDLLLEYLFELQPEVNLKENQKNNGPATNKKIFATQVLLTPHLNQDDVDDEYL